MSAAWAKLETRVVNDEFPLQRCVGSSDRSGVFLTQSAKSGAASSQLALKLVSVDESSASSESDALPSRWRAAIDLSHPHVIRIFEAGECRLEGERFLYALMEYAEQSLAQLLEQRALTEAEAREMLEPTLSALSYLHGRGFVQGQLKPSSFLVVGDELKLASDTVRSTADGYSEAEDMRALGVTLCEALTRQRPTGLEGSDAIELPDEVPAAFSEIIARCLSRDPQVRPRVSDLQAWLRGEPLPPPSAATPAPASLAAPGDFATAAGLPSGDVSLDAPLADSSSAAGSGPNASARPSSAGAPATRLVIRVELPSDEEASAPVPQQSGKRALVLAVAAIVVIALGWFAFRALLADRPASGSTAEQAVQNEPPQSAQPAAAPPRSDAANAANSRDSGSAPVNVEPAAPARSAPSRASSAPPTNGERAPKPAPSVAATEPAGAVSPVNEVLPDVPKSALQTIRGTVRVAIRVIVDKDGSVLAATPDDPGPSRYFERLSLEASKKWTFTPADAGDQRLAVVRFNYTRSGVTANSKPLP